MRGVLDLNRVGAQRRPDVSIITYKFRVKDATSGKHLDALAVQCNQVWNYLVATQREAQRRFNGGENNRWPTWVALCALTQGSSRDLGLHSDTITQICKQFAASRDLHHKCPRFRVSFGARRSLGWIAYVPRALNIQGDSVRYLGKRYRLWRHRDMPDAFKCGAFVQDARGRWYATFACEVPDDLPRGNGEVGIDLGLKTLAALSDGTVVETVAQYRRHEAALGMAQRAGNKRRAKAIGAKIANSRRHHLHVASARITRDNRIVVVGDVNASALAKTRMAKSVLDAGWSSFRRMLEYKCARRRAAFVEVDESYTTQACSACGSISGPKGRAGLSKRQWSCSDCGFDHDRDCNSAINILVAGRNAALQLTEISGR
jgi:putative transposase